MTPGYTTAKIAIALTAILAVVLILMAVLDAPWLGFAGIALLFAALIARQITIFGGRDFLISTGVLLAIAAGAFVLQRLA
jgi:hypothetical protein